MVRHFESEGRRPLLVLHERWLKPETNLAVHRTKNYRQSRKKAHSENRQRFDKQLDGGDLPEATGIKLPGHGGPADSASDSTRASAPAPVLGTKRTREQHEAASDASGSAPAVGSEQAAMQGSGASDLA